jgi:hypothetical protein
MPDAEPGKALPAGRSSRSDGWRRGYADQPIVALLKDLRQRGLLDDKLVILATAFGRPSVSIVRS